MFRNNNIYFFPSYNIFLIYWVHCLLEFYLLISGTIFNVILSAHINIKISKYIFQDKGFTFSFSPVCFLFEVYYEYLIRLKILIVMKLLLRT